MPVFQETENFTLQHKGEDCQESKNESKEDKTTKDKVNNNIQTAEEEIVIQGNRPDLSENLNLESNSSFLPTNEEQFQGNQTILSILYKPQFFGILIDVYLNSFCFKHEIIGIIFLKVRCKYHLMKYVHVNTLYF